MGRTHIHHYATKPDVHVVGAAAATCRYSLTHVIHITRLQEAGRDARVFAPLKWAR